MRSTSPCRRLPSWAPLAALACLLGGCDPAWFRQEADRIAASIIGRKQAEALVPADSIDTASSVLSAILNWASPFSCASTVP